MKIMKFRVVLSVLYLPTISNKLGQILHGKSVISTMTIKQHFSYFSEESNLGYVSGSTKTDNAIL